MAVHSSEEFLAILDKYFCTVYRFSKEDVRDTVFNSIKIFGPDGEPRDNKHDYVAIGKDSDGYHFVILRDRDTKENNIFSYGDDGGIIKSNNLDISIFKAAYRAQLN